MDIKQEELGDLVDKEMAATSAAIEAATTRIEVRAFCGLPRAVLCLGFPVKGARTVQCDVVQL